MFKEGKELICLDVELAPYAFPTETKAVNLIKNRMQLIGGQSDQLCNCFGGWLNDTPLIRSSIADTGRKFKQLEMLALKLHRKWQQVQGNSFPFRLICDQLQSPEFEWSLITAEHQSIIANSENDQILAKHFCSSIDPLIAKTAPPFKVQSVIHLLDQMPKILNMESWADFCGWHALLLDEIFAKFSYDSVDEYALERYLQEFKREAHSLYLKRARQHLLIFQLQLGCPDAPSQLSTEDRLQKEKEVIKVRYELQKLIFDHYKAIVEMANIIPGILDAHPELEQIQRISIYLRELIGAEVNDEKANRMSWGRGQMLKELLCDELKVVPAIHCDTGLLRTHFAFAIRSAIMSLKKQISSQELIDLVVNWEEKTVLLNRMAAKQGDIIDHPATRHAAALRGFVFQYLEKACAPISRWNAKGKPKHLTGKEYINLEVFNFFPSFHQNKALVEYDYKTGTLARLTSAGLKFLESLI